MTLYAVLRDGRRERVAAQHGDTLAAMLESLTADSLTGSAVTLSEARVTLASGEQIAYGDAERFEADDRF